MTIAATGDARKPRTRGAVTPVRLVLDIGTSGFGALLTSPFVERHAASLGSGPFIERALGTGIGGLATGRVARLVELRLGSLRVPRPIVGMPIGGAGFFAATWVDGTVGGGILSRLRLIVDYLHAQVIIEPRDAGANGRATFSWRRSSFASRIRAPTITRTDRPTTVPRRSRSPCLTPRPTIAPRGSIPRSPAGSR